MDRDKAILRTIFSSKVSDEAIEQLYAIAQVENHLPRKFLCKQGEYADKLYILLDGWVSVYSEIDDDLYHIDNIRSGPFGEIALMLKTVRNAHIMTREATRVLVISTSGFDQLSKSNPEIIIDLAQTVLRRILEQDKRNLVKLKTRKDQLMKQSHNTINEKMLKAIFDDISLEEITKELFSRQSIYGAPKEDAQYKTDIFMVMPFNDNLAPVYAHIKKITADMGLSIKRGDDFFTRNAIMSEIWAVTNASRLVVCDCTGKNPNVFYEMGIAHTLGKPTIMLTQDPSDIPFDLRSYRYIRYENTVGGMIELDHQLRTAIQKILNSTKKT